jgi:hypothetical protein
MPHPLSNDLRERVVAHVEAGHSCHDAAERFGTSVSFVVKTRPSGLLEIIAYYYCTLKQHDLQDDRSQRSHPWRRRPKR